MPRKSKTPVTTEPPLPKTCPRFDDPDADVIFLSSDGVMLKIHSKYLSATSGSLPIPQLLSSATHESVALSEPYETLHLLFQFIHPRSEADNFRQPSIVDMKPETLFPLAEAAEKYNVFGLMNLCITRFYQIIQQCPIEILNHAYRHGYPDLADKAAIETVVHPVDRVARGLAHPGLLHIWALLYSMAWKKLAIDVITQFDKIIPPSNCPVYNKAKQKLVVAALQSGWGGDYDITAGLTPCCQRDWLTNGRHPCNCSSALKILQTLMTDGARKIPNFNTVKP